MTEQTSAEPTIQLGGKAFTHTQAQQITLKSGNWFWWIAGLSLMNALAPFLGLKLVSIAGLGLTKAIDGLLVFFAESTPTVVLVGHLVVAISAAALFVVLGVQAKARKLWAYKVGLVIYGTDALVLFIGPDWISLAFHAFMLLMLWGGYSTVKAYNAAVGASGAIAA